MVDEDPRADDAIVPIAGMWVELGADDRAVLDGHPDRARMATVMADLVAAVASVPAQVHRGVLDGVPDGPVWVALSFEMHEEPGMFEQMTLRRWHLSVSHVVDGYRSAPPPAEVLAWVAAGFPDVTGCGVFRLATAQSGHAEIPELAQPDWFR